MNAMDLNCLNKRNLLDNHNTGTARWRQVGKEFAAAGFLSDAIDFLARADDRESLTGLIPRVIEEGDLFLLGRIRKALGQEPDPEELKVLLENAERLGKETFAERTRQSLANSAGLSTT
ncbi:MAG: hypothetical protein V1816_27865 [Pseudomonadota bacterium]